MIKFASVSDPPHHVSCIDPPQRFEVYFIFTRNLIILKIILKFITINNRSRFMIRDSCMDMKRLDDKGQLLTKLNCADFSKKIIEISPL